MLPFGVEDDWGSVALLRHRGVTQRASPSLTSHSAVLTMLKENGAGSKGAFQALSDEFLEEAVHGEQ